MPTKLKMALEIAAPTMPSTIFIGNPISLFMNCSASQPAIPPIIMAAIQAISGSPGARLLRRGCRPAPTSKLSDVSEQLARVALLAEVKANRIWTPSCSASPVGRRRDSVRQGVRAGPGGDCFKAAWRALLERALQKLGEGQKPGSTRAALIAGASWSRPFALRRI